MRRSRVGLADNWIRHVKDIANRHGGLLAEVDGHALRHDRLCELNVLEQVANVCETTIVRDAWSAGQKLHVYGWVYTLRDGRVHDLGLDVDSEQALAEQYAPALARIRVDRADR